MQHHHSKNNKILGLLCITSIILMILDIICLRIGWSEIPLSFTIDGVLYTFSGSGDVVPAGYEFFLILLSLALTVFYLIGVFVLIRSNRRINIKPYYVPFSILIVDIVILVCAFEVVNHLPLIGTYDEIPVTLAGGGKGISKFSAGAGIFIGSSVLNFINMIFTISFRKEFQSVAHH